MTQRTKVIILILIPAIVAAVLAAIGILKWDQGSTVESIFVLLAAAICWLVTYMLYKQLYVPGKPGFVKKRIDIRPDKK